MGTVRDLLYQAQFATSFGMQKATEGKP